jgi:hypothetical protein
MVLSPDSEFFRFFGSDKGVVGAPSAVGGGTAAPAIGGAR